ncbi:hypothetical protein [Streptomyces sp. SBT349]|uniref:Rv1733c family protein n=1 Tax=Streptomyces sp. SBT349 TaxID=1580539 RepID=UPI00066AEE0C|nr:hypothetical protein [Streptomyces sp. SBT349]
MANRVRLWRWRRNPLRRGSDRAEAWVCLAAGLVMGVGAPVAGTVVAVGSAEATLREGETLRRTTAEVVEAAPVPGIVGSGGRGLTAVRWRTPDGALRVGAAPVAFGSGQGARVTVWQDERGTLRDAPAGPVEAWAGGALIGGSTATAICLVTMALRGGVRAHLNARRAARWEREWAAIAPRWSDKAA